MGKEENVKSVAEKGVHLKRYLSFFLGAEEYAIDILKVKEIIQVGKITSIPNTPNFIRGVLNLRGNVITVIDLNYLFDLPSNTQTKTTSIIISEVQFEAEPLIVGLWVDAVSQVRQLSAKDIEEPPTFGTRIKVDYLEGLGKVDKKFVLILNIDRILSFKDLALVTSTLLGNEVKEKNETPLSKEE